MNGAGFRLRIDNLSLNVSDEKLAALVDDPEGCVAVSIARDWETDHSRGFGFATFADVAALQKAQEKLDGTVIDGRKVRATRVNVGPRDSGRALYRSADFHGSGRDTQRPVSHYRGEDYEGPRIERDGLYRSADFDGSGRATLKKPTAAPNQGKTDDNAATPRSQPAAPAQRDAPARSDTDDGVAAKKGHGKDNKPNTPFG